MKIDSASRLAEDATRTDARAVGAEIRGRAYPKRGYITSTVSNSSILVPSLYSSLKRYLHFCHCRDWISLVTCLKVPRAGIAASMTNTNYWCASGIA